MFAYGTRYRAMANVISMFGALAVIMALVLALGVGFMPWFSADDTTTDLTAVDRTASPSGDAGEAPTGTLRVKLLESEVCQHPGAVCGTMTTSELSDGWVGYLPWTIAGGAVLFGLLVLRADRRRQVFGEASWLSLSTIGAVGAAETAMIVVYLVKFDPGAIAYVIEGRTGFEFRAHVNDINGFTAAPKLGYGAFVTLVGLAIGAASAWRARPFRDDADEPATDTADAPAEPRPEPKRAPIEAPPRGVETDPFRAPPAPPPIRVVQHAVKTEAPRAEGGDDTPGPTLLR